MNGSELKIIPGITLDGNEPVFNEPWEASAFALVVGLHEKGLFEWTEWADILAATIRDDREDSSYYTLWLNAFEHLLQCKGLLNSQEVSERKVEWEKALLATPHGQPIELRNAG